MSSVVDAAELSKGVELSGVVGDWEVAKVEACPAVESTAVDGFVVSNADVVSDAVVVGTVAIDEPSDVLCWLVDVCSARVLELEAIPRKVVESPDSVLVVVERYEVAVTVVCGVLDSV